MKQGFSKRIFTAGTLLRDSLGLVVHFPRFFALMRGRKMRRSFIERIMTVVTAVNGCTYCAWYHARKAVESGLSEQEVANLLRLQFETEASTFELPALLFAQHYAETDGRPDAAMAQRLFDVYGHSMAHQILYVIRIILFANLAGNTFDAFLSRRQGFPARNSNALFELFFFVVSAPFLYPAQKRMRESTLPAA